MDSGTSQRLCVCDWPRWGSSQDSVFPELIETMDDKGSLLRHFLGALAYRTQKALRDQPADFGRFRAGGAVRTPSEIVRHMTSVLGYARTCYVGGKYRPDDLPSLEDEVSRFHGMLEASCPTHRRGN